VSQLSKFNCDAPNTQKESDSDKTRQFSRITPVQSLKDTSQMIEDTPNKKKRLSEGKQPKSKMKGTEYAVGKNS
jgi:hypothetical protein